jgi:hypothetical protein
MVQNQKALESLRRGNENSNTMWKLKISKRIGGSIL